MFYNTFLNTFLYVSERMLIYLVFIFNVDSFKDIFILYLKIMNITKRYNNLQNCIISNFFCYQNFV